MDSVDPSTMERCYSLYLGSTAPQTSWNSDILREMEAKKILSFGCLNLSRLFPFCVKPWGNGKHRGQFYCFLFYYCRHPVSQWIEDTNLGNKILTLHHLDRSEDIPDPAGMPLIMGFTSRSVNLSWAPSVDNHNSPILHYIIHVRVGEMGEWESAMGIMTPDNKTSYHVIGLQPYTVYSFRVMAVNAIGASEPSKESYYMVTLREDHLKMIAH
ncbi:tyrosine-protein phosphatase 99A [Trichonephila clavata]|uniref:Tyrosine-protein phosphatase 99A n=1 Tax=Trichonephila clavata TaxID=2740835 RepID=A0A8X6LJ02_TRICU|nr:tyrosine-protein phosphatase 99A [Trichonephila clavata]